jgi:uncharacterized protein YjbJ (UPF0337 family)
VVQEPGSGVAVNGINAPALKSKSRRNTMKSSTKDQVKGKYHEIKGKIKEETGDLIDDPKMEAEGASEKIAGKAQKKLGDVKDVFER